MSRQQQVRGFTLIELMISVVIGLLAIAAVGNVFLFTSRSYKQDDKVSRTQDNLRFAMAQVAADVEMAGFFAQVNNPQNDVIVSNAAMAAYTGGTCVGTWLFNFNAINTIGNSTASQIAVMYPCVTGARDNTDVLEVKRVLGSCVSAPASNKFYLRTNGYESIINYGSAGNPAGSSICPVTPTGTTVDIYEYYPVIWYVADDQGVPSLCRETLTAGGMVQDCVSQGIEDLQLEFGMDTTGTVGKPDGIADFFQSFDVAPTAAQISTIVAVRIHLLARSAERDPSYKNPKSYTVGNVTHAAQADGYYRKAMSTVVLVRNAANRVSPYSLPE